MRTYKKVQVDQDDTITCDRCGFVADCDDCEGADFLSHGTTGGFDSIFGDGKWISVDLCQRCIRDVLAPWLRINHEPYSRLETFSEPVEGVVAGSNLERQIQLARAEIATWPASVKRAMNIQG